MDTQKIIAAYEIAKELYAEAGIDTELAISELKKIKISINCWQGDDVTGFMSKAPLSGGIQVTGNYPYKATTPAELKKDLEVAFSCIPGKHRLNLHSIYVDSVDNVDKFDKKIDLCDLLPSHYEGWVQFAKKNKIALDFNPTCFSHEKAASGFTVSSNDSSIAEFWIEHCKRCRKIAEYFGKELGSPCVTNFWFPDGYKDTPIDREAPRARMKAALDEIFAESIPKQYNVDAIESKLFGIGSESYTVGSHEFVMGYAVKNNKMICLDAGHFHPTERISDKISSVLMFTDELLLHVSRPVRWDSDHVVTLDDELIEIAHSLIRTGLINRTHIGLDFFDGGINRLAAWIIGTRNMQKALLYALLEPTKKLAQIENEGNYTERLALVEEQKSLPLGAIWDYYCYTENVPIGARWIQKIRDYEKTEQSKR